MGPDHDVKRDDVLIRTGHEDQFFYRTVIPREPYDVRPAKGTGRH